VITSTRQLHVFIEDRLAGSLERDANGRLSFQYDRDYPSDATPLSPALPCGGGRFTHDAVAPFVTGLLPDDEQVIERWAKMFGVRPGNLFALLAHIGMDCAGAVQFVPDDRLDQLSESALEPIDDAGIEEMLRQLRISPTTWQQPTGARGGHFSLAGAQSKFALHRTDNGWARPFGRVPSTHIFKPSIIGIDNHDLNEHLCMRAAARLGLPAARTELVTFGAERVLIVERYDRQRTPNNDVVRVHQVDMCQALGIPPQNKYQRDGGPGPVEIITTLRNAFTGEADVERFVRSLVFHWVIAGTDAHAKNYGLLLSGTAARLTPLYDVATATMLPEWNWHKWELAMRIGRHSKFRDLHARHWQRFAATVGVPYQLIEETTVRYATAIGDALIEAGRGLPSDAEPYLHRLVDQVAEHAQTAVHALERAGDS